MTAKRAFHGTAPLILMTKRRDRARHENVDCRRHSLRPGHGIRWRQAGLAGQKAPIVPVAADNPNAGPVMAVAASCGRSVPDDRTGLLECQASMLFLPARTPMSRSDKLLLNTVFFLMYAQGIFFLHHILFLS
ncbi:hypothetical protein LHGZ1_0724 [Laribacter hongkongensis]|uniref:Uncharacterized protein n=2 Tax=Laribacter hongkongensis TaxID=168471 RepID=A0A248LGE2_9NEIS|nr:hypothetical protein LHGZ1_0724 [Laribacter hongkongensis]